MVLCKERERMTAITSFYNKKGNILNSLRHLDFLNSYSNLPYKNIWENVMGNP